MVYDEKILNEALEFPLSDVEGHSSLSVIYRHNYLPSLELFSFSFEQWRFVFGYEYNNEIQYVSSALNSW
jgi:hypothetical protein